MPKANTDFVSLLFRECSRDLLGYLRLRLQSQEAEDIAQKAYLKLLQHPNPAEIQNPRAYLFRTAANLMLNHVRHQKLRSDLIEAGADPDTVVSSTPPQEKALEDKRQLDRLREVLAELPPLCRHAFLLHRIDGLTHAEIARRLGVSQKSVERYIIKAFDLCYCRLGRPKPNAKG